ncbi:DNA methyltransferase [Mucilaginibacter sp. 10I4]|uniref:DNA methyltransferase n=1 Tax=Mucilaginibacter sp. 10I4 TaxID=3048580 RepID=UPI002B23867E|nr:DNA methyltransferase [Mucilaginibacter sp. 10I4]MEB0262882.1 DNA methyltransferase [Mucilaginibacter sp. 10I4]
MISEAVHMDNMAYMAGFPDKFFDLAIVDPPYGLNFGSFNRTNTDSTGVKRKANKYKNSEWDIAIPNQEYFNELFRVSKNQVIFGGNYFPLPPTQCFIFWYKQNPVANFSDGELAWTSFRKPALCFDYRYFGNISGKSSADVKHHPTQKPIQLYDFVLKKLGGGVRSVIDTHLGSGSSRIAAYNNGFDFYGCELDKDYFEAQEKRFTKHIAQTQLFAPEKQQQLIQTSLL